MAYLANLSWHTRQWYLFVGVLQRLEHFFLKTFISFFGHCFSSRLLYILCKQIARKTMDIFYCLSLDVVILVQWSTFTFKQV